MTEQHDPHDVVSQALAATADTRNIACRLRELVELHEEPAQLLTITFTAAEPTKWQGRHVDDFSASIGLLNPTSLTVFLGLSGSPTAAARAVPVGPNQLLVLPVSAGALEMAVDPAALGANSATVYLLRYASVQPAFLGLGA